MKISAIAVPVIDPEKLEVTKINFELQTSLCRGTDNNFCRAVGNCWKCLLFYQHGKLFLKIARRYWGFGGCNVRTIKKNSDRDREEYAM